MRKFTFFIFICIVGFTVNDIHNYPYEIFWDSGLILEGNKYFFSFKDCEYDESNSYLPYYIQTLPIAQSREYHIEFDKIVFEEFNINEEDIFEFNKIPEDFQIEVNQYTSQKKQIQQIKVLPLKKEGDKVYRLLRFSLKYIPVSSLKSDAKIYDWKSHSVLESGEWVKISTSQKGIYKIPYAKLEEWGFSNPQDVNVFGNSGYMLPENNNDILYDDLSQVSVWHGADCIFLYSPGTIKWEWDNDLQEFIHTTNIYSENMVYFLSDDIGVDKLVDFAPEIEETVTDYTDVYDYYELHEVESRNLIYSGKRWFGERFVNNTELSLNFDLVNRDEDFPVNFSLSTAGRSMSYSFMEVLANNEFLDSIKYIPVNKGSQTSQYAYDNFRELEMNPDNNNLEISLKYLAPEGSDEAWLDFLRLNYRRKLNFNENYLLFRDTKSVGENRIVQFSINNSRNGLRVFDVTSVTDILEMPKQLNGTELVFKNNSDILKEYLVFDPEGNYPVPDFIGNIDNQDIHALPSSEFIIISHPDFIEYANELASFHRNYDEMAVSVVTTEEVYNEFSSGIPDATGIKNFIKMCYEKNNQLKYIQLFGDGSYDNRNISGKANNFVPTYQSDNSLVPVNSFVTDDYFVMLDYDESIFNGAIDLGIGRLPVKSEYEAQLVVNKIKSYYDQKTLGPWRNLVCFIGDDEDGNLHMRDSERLADQVNENYGAFITDKIYFDAFFQETSTAGEKYPGVTDAINNIVDEGVLILNYIGHANDRFLANEHVLDISDINSWTNENNLPIFVTATCEFSRFDADETSAGEYILLNPNGGGIGLFSTTRVVFASSNFLLNRNFFNYVFEQDEQGEHYRMGDIMRLAKVNTASTINKRNFTLLADPALRLSYPKYRVVTSSINQKNAGEDADTLNALDLITITGYVSDYFGNKLDNFNGELTPIVYDKSVVMETLGNAGATPMKFDVQNNIIYKGLSSINNGEFTFSFVIPKDITYNIGKGKIMYYAEDGSEDAHGSFEGFYIGGSSGSQITDTQGPEVDLYIDHTNFVSGDETSRNPLLLAYISDENGINTVGTGIGHDITAILDNDYSSVYVLNEYYQAEIDNYKSGKITFQFSNLSVGQHTLKLKVWDVANNSTEKEIDFVVTDDFFISEVRNYPNPFKDYTFFTFLHNQPDAIFEVYIEIFDSEGNLVDSFETNVSSNGLESNPIQWNLSDSNLTLSGGVYIYRVHIKSEEGLIASKSGKMVIVR